MESEQLEREKQRADVQKQQEVQQEQGEDLEVSMAHALGALSSCLVMLQQWLPLHLLLRACVCQLQLHLKMPDGTDAVVEARLGYTVEYVKALLHEQFGLPIAQQVRAGPLQEL